MTPKIDGSIRMSPLRVGRSGAAAVIGWTLIVGGCNSRQIMDAGESNSPDTDAPNSATSAPATTPLPPDAGVLDGGILDAGGSTDAGSGDGGPADAGSEDAGLEDAGGDGGITPGELELDLFGTFHNTFNFVVSDEQRTRMNEPYVGGGPIFVFDNPYGDIYTPGGAEGGKTYVDYLFVTNPDGDTANFGKTEVKLVGQSTGRAWTESTLPNLRVDTNEFIKGHKLDGYEHIRFNNGVVSSIFREKFTLDFYRELGYPAPMAGYAWVQSPVWGAEAKIPYGVVEVYKRPFCKRREDYFGGECSNMWEFAGDFGQGQFSSPEACQFNECESSRVMELDELVLSTPPGAGFKDALADYWDWDAFHEFQCLSWIFATGDDVLHNTNNFVLVERADGKFQHLPYSVDISFGQDWYRYVELVGRSSVARGCQADPQCWADTVATCDVLLDAFEAADPVGRLDTLYSELGAAGMLRNGDDRRYEDMRAYIEERLVDMPAELDAVREDPYVGGCPTDQIMCGNYCAYPWECHLCEEGGGGGYGGGLGELLPIDWAAEPNGANDAIIVEPPPVSEPRGDAGAPPPEGDAGVEPNPCLPYYDVYGVR